MYLSEEKYPAPAVGIAKAAVSLPGLYQGEGHGLVSDDFLHHLFVLFVTDNKWFRMKVRQVELLFAALC